jgi:hypothetical protein
MRPRPIVALLALATLGGLAAPAFVADPPPVKAVDIQRDLVLVAALTSARTIQPGNRIAIDVRLENRSTDTAYRVVKPGDGSESGWREPHVWFSAQRETTDGDWEDVPRSGIGRCGLFDADWHDEVTELAPGKSLALQDWMPMPTMTLDFQKSGRVRLYAHYAYAAKAPGKGLSENPAPDGLGPMEGVEPFTLVSAPVELTVQRPFELIVEQKTPLRVGRKVALTQVIDISVKNLLDRKLVIAPSSWALSPQQRGSLLLLEQVPPPPAAVLPARDLAGRATADLTKAGVRLDYSVEAGAAGKAPFLLHVRIAGKDGNDVAIRSQWVELTIDP